MRLIEQNCCKHFRVLHLYNFLLFSIVIYQIFSYRNVFFRNLNTGWVVTTTLSFANSSINPFLYRWRLRELRAAVKEDNKENSSSCVIVRLRVVLKRTVVGD